uniref:Uncharacterized protein n=1 Tax=viral metagenome TaxID=1070528 RepID=A0A6C0KHF6_9ZZZZ
MKNNYLYKKHIYVYYIMKNLYYNLGVGVAILLVIYFFFTTLKINSQILEGLTNSSSSKTSESISTSVEELKKINEQLEDTINLSKYRTDYEDYFLALEENINLSLLLQITELYNSGNKSVSVDDITKLNETNKLKDTINDIMTFMDSKKSSKKMISLF